MHSFFSERNFFFSAIKSFFFEIWMAVKTNCSEVFAVQIEKKKELIEEKKEFLEEKKSIRDLSLKIATFLATKIHFFCRLSVTSQTMRS